MIFVSKPQADNFAQNYLKYAPGFMQLITNDPTELFRFGGKEEKDLIWLEWANDLTAAITCHKWNAPVMVRVHDHEIYKGRIQKVHWENVDFIWFINRQAQEDFNKIMGDKVKHCKQFFLPNAVDPQPFTRNVTTNKHIGMLSIYFRPRKRFDRAIEVMRHLNRLDHEWKLTIRADIGPFPDEYLKCKQMVEDLGVNVEFDPRIIQITQYGSDKCDVNDFFADKSVVMSTSDHEGFHYAIAEGALCGCAPVVYDWEWGRAGDFWKQFLCGDPEEMANIIFRLGKIDMLRELGNEGRRYVMQNFQPWLLGEDLARELNIDHQLFHLIGHEQL